MTLEEARAIALEATERADAAWREAVEGEAGAPPEETPVREITMRSSEVVALVKAHARGDNASFMRHLNCIIANERAAGHDNVANQLKSASGNTPPAAPPVPKSNGIPMFEVRSAETKLKDLILSNMQSEAIGRIVWEFEERQSLRDNGQEPARSILLYGPPGSGKTSTANAIAESLDMPVMHVKYDSLVTSLLGETGANLAKVFDYAKNGEWVLLVDEFDSLGTSRTSERGSDVGEMKRILNSFLQKMDEMKGYDVIVVASTNLSNTLDPALARRFDTAIEFLTPTLEQVEALIGTRFAKFKCVDDIFVRSVEWLYDQKSSFAEVAMFADNTVKSCILWCTDVIDDWTVEHAMKTHTARRIAWTEEGSRIGFP